MVDLGHGHACPLEKIEPEIIQDQRLHHHRCAADDEDIETGKAVCQPLQRLHRAAVAAVRLLDAQKDHQNRQHKGDRGPQKRDAHRRPHAGQDQFLPLDRHIDHRVHEARGVLLKFGTPAHGLGEAYAAPDKQRQACDPGRGLQHRRFVCLPLHDAAPFHSCS